MHRLAAAAAEGAQHVSLDGTVSPCRGDPDRHHRSRYSVQQQRLQLLPLA